MFTSVVADFFVVANSASIFVTLPALNHSILKNVLPVFILVLWCFLSVSSFEAQSDLFCSQ